MTVSKKKKNGYGIAIGAAFGVAIGAAFGASSDEMALSIGVYLAIGTAVGAVVDFSKRSK